MQSGFLTRRGAARWLTGLALMSAGVIAVGISARPAAAQGGPLVVGVDVGANPYVIANPDGSVTGFNIDLVTEVAKRMGRPGIRHVDQQFAGIFAGLEAKRYEFIAAPVTMTQERSTRMLFLEGFLDTNYQFLAPRDAPEIKSLDDLKGKTIAVNNGSAYDTWLTQNEGKYGFKIERYGKNADAFQAVLARRADLAMSGDGNVRYAAAQNNQLKASYIIRTGAVFSWAFRRDDAETRRAVERIVECLKLDGTAAAIYKKWFGEDPEPGSATVTVYAGTGHPGMDGYEAVYQPPKCS